MPPESSQPATVTPAPTAEVKDDALPEIDWGEMDADFDKEDEPPPVAEKSDEPKVVEPAPAPDAPQPPPEVPPPKVETPPAVAVTPAPTPAVVTEPVTPVVAPAVTPEPAPAPVPAPAAFTQEDVNKWRDERVAHFSTVYSMSEDEGLEFIRAPEKVLPGIAARLIVDVEQHVYNSLTHALPAIINRQFEDVLGKRKTERTLLKQWDQLGDPKHREVYDRTLAAYRAANPNATEEQTIREVGAASYMALGLVPTAPAAAPAETPATPVAEPFTPAVPGAVSAATTPKVKSDNVFTLLADEMDKDDAQTG